MMNDILSDSLTRIRNGYMRGLEKTSLLNSKLVRAVLKVLKEEGYIGDFEVNDQNKIDVELKYYKKQPVMQSVRRISTCGQRRYCRVDKLNKIKKGFRLFILSTSQGVMTHVKAESLNIGGEILLEVF